MTKKTITVDEADLAALRTIRPVVADAVHFDRDAAIGAIDRILAAPDENALLVLHAPELSPEALRRIRLDFRSARASVVLDSEPTVGVGLFGNPLPHVFERGPDGQANSGPPDETCAKCGTDPRNTLHSVVVIGADGRCRCATSLHCPIGRSTRCARADLEPRGVLVAVAQRSADGSDGAVTFDGMDQIRR